MNILNQQHISCEKRVIIRRRTALADR